MDGWILLVAMVTLSLRGCLCGKNFSVNTQDDGFNVTVGNVPIFQHSQRSAMLYVGRGNTVFTEALGNFHIKNYIQDRIGLYRYNYTDDVNTLVLEDGNSFKVRITFQSTAGQDLVLKVDNLGAPFTHAWLRILATPEEQIFGGGEQFSYLNLRDSAYRSLQYFTVLRADDKVYPIWTREQGVGRDKSTNTTFFADLKSGGGGDFTTTYFPQPTFVSSRKYYMHFTGTGYMTFDFSVPQFHEVMMKGNSIADIYLKAQPSIKALVQGISQTLGCMPILPQWAYDGIIMGVQGGTDVMMQRYNQAIAAGVKIRGLWIQDWAGILRTSFGQRLFWNWKWNATTYPNLDQKIKDLKKDGVRITTYVNPNLNIEGDLYKDAQSKGFVVLNATNQPYIFNFGEFYCGIIDLTNPSAVTWYKKNIIYVMIDMGISGWMADFGEYLPVDAKLWNNQSGEAVHNTWPVLWAKLNREAVQEKGKLGEIVFWMRAGFTGSSNYTTLLWAGDQNVDFSTGDGLPSTIPAALSAGISGIGMTHFDIGGYTTFGALGLMRNEELLLRSAEMAVFTPVMRTHEGNQPSFNIQMYSNTNMLKLFKRLVDIHNLIANYTLSVMNEHVASGLPAQRPLFMMYPGDAATYNIKYQYMYGTELLVAPVIAPSVTTQKVYLPKGENWVFVWNNTDVANGNILVNAPIGMPPVFYRKSSPYASLFSKIADFKRFIIPTTTVAPPSSGADSAVCQKQFHLHYCILFILCFIYFTLRI